MFHLELAKVNFGGMTFKCANYIAEINCLLYFTGHGE